MVCNFATPRGQQKAAQKLYKKEKMEKRMKSCCKNSRKVKQ